MMLCEIRQIIKEKEGSDAILRQNPPLGVNILLQGFAHFFKFTRNRSIYHLIPHPDN
jgi:hypothetical protein